MAAAEVGLAGRTVPPPQTLPEAPEGSPGGTPPAAAVRSERLGHHPQPGLLARPQHLPLAGWAGAEEGPPLLRPPAGLLAAMVGKVAVEVAAGEQA